MTPTSQPTDGRAIDRAADRAFARFVRDRDPDALAEVFDRTAHRLTLVAARLVGGDAHEAEDVVQATFLEAIRSAERFQAGARVMPWLLGILTHQAARVRRRRTATPADPAASQLAAARSADPEPGALAADRDLAEQIEAAVCSLDAPYREVLALRLLHDLRPIDIATALDRPLGTVRAQLHRGLDRLRRVLPAGLAGSVLAAFGGDALAQVRAHVLREAGRLAVPVAAGGAGATTLFSLGALMTAKTLSLFLAASAVGLAALVLYWPGGEPVPATPLVEGGGAPGVVRHARLPIDGEDRGAATRTAVDTEGETSAPLAPGDVRFHGRVVARENGAPLAGAEIRVTAYSMGRNRVEDHWVAPEPVFSDSEGLFSVDVGNPEEVALEVWVSAAGRVTIGGGHSDLRSDVDVGLGDVSLARATWVTLRVVGADGRPLQGRTVRAVADEPYRLNGGVLALADDIGWSRESATDRTGRLPSRAQRAGRYTLDWGFHDGPGVPIQASSVSPRRFDVDGALQEQEVLLVVAPPDPETSVSGRVLDVQGRPLGGVALEFHNPGGGWNAAWAGSDPDGRLLARGFVPNTPLRIVPANRGAWRLVRPQVAVHAGDQDVEVVLEPIPVRELILGVRDARGRSSGSQLLSLLRWGDVGSHGHERWQRALDFANLPRTGRTPDGSWALRLSDGDHRAVVGPESGEEFPLNWCDFQVGPESQEVDLDVPDPIGWKVWVREPDGAAVGAVRVALRWSMGSRWRKSMLQAEVGEKPIRSTGMLDLDRAVTSRDGLAELHSPEVLGAAWVAVSGTGVLHQAVPLDRVPAGRSLEVVVRAGGIVHGRVFPLEVLETLSDPERVLEPRRRLLRVERPISARVTLESEAGSERVKVSVDEEGVFRFEAVPRGTWLATLEDIEGFPALPFPGGPIQVIPGEGIDIAFDLSGLQAGEARLRIPQDDRLPEEVELRLQGASEHLERGVSTADGSASIEQLAPGPYRAVVTGWSGESGNRRRVCFRAAALSPIAPGRTSDWSITPEVSGGVRLQCVVEDGRPLANRGLRWSDANTGDARWWPAGTTGSDGRLDLDPAPARSFVLQLADSSGHGESRSIEVTVEPNARWTERRIVLPD